MPVPVPVPVYFEKLVPVPVPVPVDFQKPVPVSVPVPGKVPVRALVGRAASLLLFLYPSFARFFFRFTATCFLQFSLLFAFFFPNFL